MRLRLGPPPSNADFAPEREGWQPLREPSLRRLTLLGGTLAFLVLCALLSVWPRDELTDWSNVTIAQTLLVFLITSPLHELLHAVVHPGWGLTAETEIGLWPSRLVAYAHYQGERTRERFIVELALPLVLLSIVPLIVALLVSVPGTWLPQMAFLNSLLSAGDLAAILVIVAKAPRGARLRNQGYFTWWKQG